MYEPRQTVVRGSEWRRRRRCGSGRLGPRRPPIRCLAWRRGSVAASTAARAQSIAHALLCPARLVALVIYDLTVLTVRRVYCIGNGVSTIVAPPMKGDEPYPWADETAVAAREALDEGGLRYEDVDAVVCGYSCTRSPSRRQGRRRAASLG